LIIQQFNQKIYADEKIEGYVTELVDATRYPENYTLGRDINGLIEYGASPRASIWAILTGKAHALLNGRGYVIPEDIKAVVHDVLRHRIILTYEADAEDITSDHIIDMLVANIKAP
jgi:MoxR-like ATPase